MQLIQIDKARYRKHLNRVIIGCGLALAAGSLAISQTLIALFPDESGSHFHWNLLGVIVTSITIGWALNKYRGHDYMTEVVYVWELKQALNKITRKMAKLKAAGREGDPQFITVMLVRDYCGSLTITLSLWMSWQLSKRSLIVWRRNLMLR